MIDYNTDKDPLILKEYGRNVQNLVKFITEVEDKEKRTAYVHTLIKTLKQLNPVVRDSSENTQRIWDHIYVMSGKTIDIENPFSNTSDEERSKPPMTVDYAQHKLKYRHYGNNIELLVKQVMGTEDKETRMRGLGKVGRIMKSFYGVWNKDKIEDEMIVEHIQNISGKKIDIDLETIKAMGMFDINEHTHQKDIPNNQSSPLSHRNRGDRDKNKNKRHQPNNYRNKRRK